jgi:type II secretory pathway pseudopilin PulG
MAGKELTWVPRAGAARGRRSGFTLTEAMVVSVCAALLLTLMVRAVLGISALNYHSAQRVAAYGICRERLELARAADYATLTVGVQEETIRFGHLNGLRRRPLEGRVTTLIEAHTSPRKRWHVDVSVTWTHGTRTFTERAAAILYPSS